jgi:hypothetical protein
MDRQLVVGWRFQLMTAERPFWWSFPKLKTCVCVCVCGGGGGGRANGLTYLLRIPRKLAVFGYTLIKENLCRTFSGPK